MSAVTDIIAIICLSAALFYLLHRMILIVNETITKKKAILDAKEAKRQGKKESDSFFQKYGYSWEFVIVFPILEASEKPNKQQARFSVREVITRLQEAGFETKMFFSVQKDEVYCKIRAPYEILEKEAERIEHRVLLDGDRLQELCELGRDGKWKGFKITDEHQVCKYDPCEFIYAKYYYSRDDLKDLYMKSDTGCITPSNNGILGTVDRIKLTMSIIQARKLDGGCQIDLNKLKVKGALLGSFPLQDDHSLLKLQGDWLNFLSYPWKQPVDRIKNYFGEKIGLYFVFLGHYTTWLIVPAIAGFFSWINVAAEDNNPDAQVIPYFSIFIALWATCFLEFWKRKESTIAMKWGMSGYEEIQQARPEFKGEIVLSPVDGSKILYFPNNEKLKLVIQSQSLVICVIIVVIGAITSIFLLKLFLTTGSRGKELGTGGVEWGAFIASLVNAVQIQLMEKFYNILALYLNNRENHRTDTLYEDSLIGKTFMFQFVNSYASLFYIAFLKSPFTGEQFGDCVPSGTCMTELQTALGTIFLVRLAVGNITEIGIPAFKAFLRQRENAKGAEEVEMSDAEAEFLEEEYHVMLGPFGDYAEMVIQFGYTTMFVAAFPLAPLMALINNYIEIRVDGWKLCQQSRRPIPTGAEDIGTWYVILEIMTTCTIIINGALFTLTGTSLNDFTWAERVGYFVLFEHLVFLAKFCLQLMVPDVPYDVEIQLKRNEFIISKVVDNTPDFDEIDDTFAIKHDTLTLDLTVRTTDDDDPRFLGPDPADKKDAPFVA